MRTKWMPCRPLELAAAVGAVMALGCSDDAMAPVDPGPPASGDLTVNVTVTGAQQDPDGFWVDLSSSERGHVDSRAVAGQGGEVSFADLTPGPYVLNLVDLATNCGGGIQHPIPVLIRSSATTSVTIPITCSRNDATAVYMRQDGGVESLSLYPDSTFSLAKLEGEIGDFVSVTEGTYHYVSASEIFFSFVANAPEWSATGTLHDDCMSVRYSLQMAIDGFADGEFCK